MQKQINTLTSDEMNSTDPIKMPKYQLIEVKDLKIGDIIHRINQIIDLDREISNLGRDTVDQDPLEKRFMIIYLKDVPYSLFLRYTDEVRIRCRTEKQPLCREKLPAMESLH